jgi:hypothetical protein
MAAAKAAGATPMTTDATATVSTIPDGPEQGRPVAPTYGSEGFFVSVLIWKQYCRDIYLLRLQYLMLKYGDMVRKQQNNNKDVYKKRENIFS